MLKNSCFISFRHLEDTYEFPEFLTQFHKVLNAQLVAMVKGNVFLDKERLEGGDLIDEKLAVELCSSCCMVMIFCPTYFDNDSIYCTREFLSMKKLEKFRKKYLPSGKGLIIPVIYKDIKFFKNSNLKGTLAYNFTEFGLWGGASIVNSQDMYSHVREIAQYITDRFRELKTVDPICHHSGEHILVSEQEAKDWLIVNSLNENEPNDEYPR